MKIFEEKQTFRPLRKGWRQRERVEFLCKFLTITLRMWIAAIQPPKHSSLADLFSLDKHSICFFTRKICSYELWYREEKEIPLLIKLLLLPRQKYLQVGVSHKNKIIAWKVGSFCFLFSLSKKMAKEKWKWRWCIFRERINFIAEKVMKKKTQISCKRRVEFNFLLKIFWGLV